MPKTVQFVCTDANLERASTTQIQWMPARPEGGSPDLPDRAGYRVTTALPTEGDDGGRGIYHAIDMLDDLTQGRDGKIIGRTTKTDAPFEPLTEAEAAELVRLLCKVRCAQRDKRHYKPAP